MLGLEQSSYMVGEGDGTVAVCVEVMAAPAGANLECEIVAAMVTNDGAKAGNGIKW